MTAEADRAVETQDNFHLTDVGNAQRLVQAHGKEIRYLSADKVWFVWDASRGTWSEDKSGEITRRAVHVVQAGLKAAIEIEDDEVKKAKVKHFLKSESAPSIRNMIEVARAAKGVAVQPADFDADPFLLNCANGVVDLRKGAVIPHDPSLLCAKRTSASYLPDAPATRWEAFLREITLGDEVLLTFLRRALGYSLTGSTAEHAVFFPYGLGANGKSVLLETVRHVLGDYAATTDVSTFLAGKDTDNAPRNDLARLPGVRFLTAIESEEGARLAEGLLKSMTGGDTVTARFNYGRYFEFRPQFKLWFATNHKPSIRGTDKGIWRRVHLIPFLASFDADKADQNLTQRLKAESDGILSWLVQACLEWQTDTIGFCPVVQAATADYRAEQDLLGRFIDERCALGAGYNETAAALYEHFRKWCEGEGEKPWTKKTMGMRLAERGFKQVRTKKDRIWEGLYAEQQG